MRKFFRGGEISVDLSQKGGATQKRLGTTDLRSIMRLSCASEDRGYI